MLTKPSLAPFRGLLGKSLLSVAALAPAAAWAAFSDHPLTLVVPYTAGGLADGLARMLADATSKELGQPVVVENKPGANTKIATLAVARAQSDGYTLLLSSSVSRVLNPLLCTSVGYDPAKDFKLVVVAAEMPLVVVTNPTTNVATLQEFAWRSNLRKGAFSYASIGRPE